MWIISLIVIVVTLVCGASNAASEEALPTHPQTNGTVYIIPIRGMIEPALLYVIRRGLDEAHRVNAKAIIFPMDTPGGTLEAATEIVRTIQQIKVPTYTFVEKNAFSAGAIIALATDHIYMAPGSVIGDAMPILMTPFGQIQEMPEDLREKTVSAVAALVRAAAQQSGHRVEVAEKMVRRELELQIDDEVISPAGQLLTLTNVEAERIVKADGKPLLSAGTVQDLDELLARIGLQSAQQKELVVTSAERLARFVAAMAPLFLIAGLLGIYIEMRTPGFGIPGLVGIVCLAIFFWGHHIAGLAGWEELVLFIVGTVFLLIELLFIPGFGIVGITGILLMLGALLSAMVRRLPTGPIFPTWIELQWPLLKLVIALIATFGIGALLGPLFPKLGILNRLVLARSTARTEGFTATREDRSLIGMEGITLSPLRPSGVAKFSDRKLDVITEGDFVEVGRKVKIVDCHGPRIIVKEVDISDTRQTT